MKTLIIGAGYLGVRVGQRLLALGDQVTATTRSTERSLLLNSLGMEPLVLDLLRPETLETIPEVDRTLYCIGFDRRGAASRREVTVEGLHQTLNVLLRRSKAIVYTSTSGVYGDHQGGVVDESTPAQPITESGKLNLEAEELLQSAAATGGIPTTILRYSGLYGPGRLLRSGPIKAGEPIQTHPESFLNLIQIDDAAAATVLALQSSAVPTHPLYLVTDDQPVTRGDFYTTLAALLHAPTPRFVAPPQAETARSEANKRLSNARIKEALGFAPRYPTFETGLAAAIEAERSGLNS